MNFLGFGQSADIDIVFDGSENRKMAEIKTEDGRKEKYLLYYDGETVSGKVNVTLKKPGTKLEHHGIKIELIGQIELYYDRGNRHEFLTQLKELARHGDLIKNTSYPFEFPNVEKPYEVYVGSNVRLRYFLRVTIVRRISDIIREVDIAVHTLSSYPEINSPIKMEVGIEDCLHIEFEYNKSKYHLKDVIVGKIYFLLVRIKIKHMEIAIIKRETTGAGSNVFTDNETIAKYEIMDGAPVKGESIPIRVFLAGYDLTPTMREINKKFSVRYFLNLVLMDTEDRRYFKQQEITLWRKPDKTRKSISGGASGAGGSVSNAIQNAQMPSHLVESSHSTQAKLLPDGTVAPGPSVASNSDPLTPSSNVGDQTMGLFTEEVESNENSTNNNTNRNRNTNPLLFEEDDDDIMATSSAQTNSKPQQQQQQQQENQEQPTQTANDTSSLFDSPVEGASPSHTTNTTNSNDISNNETVVEQKPTTDDSSAQKTSDKLEAN